MLHVETDTVGVVNQSATASVHLETKKKQSEEGGKPILMLRSLVSKTRVRPRDDDRAAREAGRRHGRHLEDLAVEELIEFGESGHTFPPLLSPI